MQQPIDGVADRAICSSYQQQLSARLQIEPHAADRAPDRAADRAAGERQIEPRFC